jgi:hypothetical protein
MQDFAQKQDSLQPQTSPHVPEAGGKTRAAGHQPHLMHLQHTIGNQAVLRLMRANAIGPHSHAGAATSFGPNLGHDFGRAPAHPRSPAIVQTKLTVNSPGDVYEQEADNVSEQVMRAPEPQLQRACACSGTCDDCQKKQSGQHPAPLQMKRSDASAPGQTEAPPSVHQALQSPGQPLDSATRAFMEPRFGQDFSHVRVHTDQQAAASANAVDAQAYTVGPHVVFGAGTYDTKTDNGRKLLAHELSHTIQQAHGSVPASPLEVGRRDDPAEAEADSVATHVSSGATGPVAGLAHSSPAVRRGPGGGDKDRSSGLTKAEWAKIQETRKYFNLPDRPTSSKTTIVGILIDNKTGIEYPLHSGEEGGPSGGTQRGFVPRGKNEAFTQGAPHQGNIATHVEGHSAQVMHESSYKVMGQLGITDATLLIEEEPCLVCDSTRDWDSTQGNWTGKPTDPHGTPNISTALPPGTKLRVVYPGGVSTYSSSQIPSTVATPPSNTPPGASGGAGTPAGGAGAKDVATTSGVMPPQGHAKIAGPHAPQQGTGGGGPATKPIIYLDASVIIEIERGNVAAAEQLKEFLQTADVRMADEARTELVDKPGWKEVGKAHQIMIDDLHIVVMPSAPAERVASMAARNTVKGKTGTVSVIDPKDIAMAAAVPREAQLWTLDKRLVGNRNAAKEYLGIDLHPASWTIESSKTPKGASPPSDYSTGRDLMGLDPVVIDSDGKLVRRGRQGSVTKGVSTTKVPSDQLVTGVIVDQGNEPTGQGRTGDDLTSSGGVKGTTAIGANLVTPTSVEKISSGVSARDLVAESAKYEWDLKLISGATTAAWGYLHYLNIKAHILEIARAYDLAIALSAKEMPFQKEIDAAYQAESHAKEVQAYFNSLDLRASIPSPRTPEWNSQYDLYPIQVNYLNLESKLHQSIEWLKTAQSDLEKQQEDMIDLMRDREKYLQFPITSLPYAEAYFFADAGGKINPALRNAQASYRDAQRAAEFADRMAQAAAKTLELRIRELISKEFPDIEKPGGEFSDLSTDEIRSSDLEKFTQRR